MMTYKVSYVVIGGKHPGAIMSADRRPHVGDYVWLNDNLFEIVEISEVMPPRGGFAFLHATVKLAETPAAAVVGTP